jgi:predicted PurR-regulated permease PerM
MKTWSLSRNIQLLLFCFLTIGGLYFAREFLIPLTIAGILSMLFLPVSRWLEHKGLHRGIAVLICMILFFAAVAGFAALLTWQVSNLAEDLPKMQQRISALSDQIKQYISETLNISEQKQEQIIEEQQSSGTGNAGQLIGSIFGGLMSALLNFILVLVYIFLLMFFRTHIKKFILMIVPQNDKQESQRVIEETSKVGQQYLTSLGMMIVILWIMYGIGFSIVGVKSAIFFAILCGVLEIIPFIGNITGTTLTVMMVFSQGSNSSMVFGVIITYLFVQFIQTYLLEPLVVGHGVNINPLFTIMVLVAGELIWGLPGLVLAIPLLGMIKIICTHIEPLKPYGFLIGEEKKPKKHPNIFEKIKKSFN